MAAENWLCGVRATLGLADPPYYLCDGDSIVWKSANPCGEGTYPMLCDLGALCEPQADYYFIAGTCRV